MPDYIGEHIDRLITTEIKNRGMPHGFLIELYEVARKEAGGRPLTTLAAEGLVRSVGKGDAVFLMTGAGYPPHLPKGESDGPPGAAALARALYRGFGAVPVYVCEANHVDPVIASSEAAHIMVKDFADARDLRLGAAIVTAPTSSAEVADWAKAIYDEYQPKALISIERLGPNEHGIHNSATGWTIGEETGIVDLTPVVTEAEARGVFSIGTGDHGNEIGFGRIHDDVKRIMPQGAKSQSGTPAEWRRCSRRTCSSPRCRPTGARTASRRRSPTCWGTRISSIRPRWIAPSSPSASRRAGSKPCTAAPISSSTTARENRPWPSCSFSGTWFA